MADAATDLLRTWGGSVGLIATTLGGKLLAHMCLEYTVSHFRYAEFSNNQELVRIVKHGVPVDARRGGCLARAPKHGNHSSA